MASRHRHFAQWADSLEQQGHRHRLSLETLAAAKEDGAQQATATAFQKAAVWAAPPPFESTTGLGLPLGRTLQSLAQYHAELELPPRKRLPPTMHTWRHTLQQEQEP